MGCFKHLLFSRLPRINRGIPLAFFSMAVVLATAVVTHGDVTHGNSDGDAHPVLQRVRTPECSTIIDAVSDARERHVARCVPFGLDDQLWGSLSDEGDRQNLIAAIDQSLAYLDTPAAVLAYADYPVPEFTRDRIQRSLVRFRALLLTSPSAEALQTSVLEEFEFYQSIGSDGVGTVAFTGYFEPTYAASRVQTSEYRYPLYRKPTDFDAWSLPHPTRSDLEGHDGLQGSQGLLQGYELVWLGDRLEAFLIQVQGSARLQLIDGSEVSVGYAGRTDYPYRSIGRMLIDDGHIPEEELSLPKLLEFFAQNPSALDRYLPQNDRFVFFRETYGAPPQGTLSVPVTPERSIATDKSLMPPGALALIVTDIPFEVLEHVLSMPGAEGEESSTATGIGQEATVNPDEQGDELNFSSFPLRRVNRYVLDQDTGGAIQGPGRVDIFMGSGPQAGARAGLINTDGQLYYLLLRES